MNNFALTRLDLGRGVSLVSGHVETMNIGILVGFSAVELFDS